MFFEVTRPVPGAQFFVEKKNFCAIKRDWDAYLGTARKTVFERGKVTYTDLLSRALESGNTNLAERVSNKFIPKNP